MSTNRENQVTKQEKGRVVSVSVPPGRRAAFDAALASLKRHHENPFIQAAPLIVETIIEAARRLQAEEQESTEKRNHGSPPGRPQ